MDKKIKITYYSGNCEAVGGDIKYLFDLINNLDSNKYEIELFTDKSQIFAERANQHLDSKIKVNYLNTKPALFKKGIMRITDSGIFKLLTLAPIRYGIHNWLVFSRLFRDKKNSIDIFHFNNGGYPAKKAGLIAIIVARLYGVKKIIISLHSVPIPRKWYKISEVFLDSLVKKYCTTIIATSRHIKEELVRLRDFPEDKIEVIPCGLNDAPLRSQGEISNIKNRLKLASDTPVLSITANIDSPQKGHAVLFESLVDVIPQHKHLKLLVIGDGVMKNELIKLNQKYKLDNNIVFMGFRQDIDDLNSIIDIAILPSITFESIPYAVKEAMRAAKPVIATDTGGFREAVEHNINGLIVPAGNPKKLSEAISVLLNNPDLRIKMGTMSRKFFEDRFLLSEAILKHENIYQRS